MVNIDEKKTKQDHNQNHHSSSISEQTIANQINKIASDEDFQKINDIFKEIEKGENF